jgi:hypothetical protein
VALVGFCGDYRHFVTSSSTNRLHCREEVWCSLVEVAVWLMLEVIGR